MNHRQIFYLCCGTLLLAAGSRGFGEQLNEIPLLFEKEVPFSASLLERGQYLVNGVLWCFQCHSERDRKKPGHPPRKDRIGAGRILFDEDDTRLVAPNLTPDAATGIGKFSNTELARAIRQGIGRDGRRLRVMPTASFSVLSDEDLAGVIVYLRSLKPVVNRLPQSVPVSEADAEAAKQPLRAIASRDQGNPVERGRYLIELADCVGCHTAWAAPRMPGALAGGNEMDRATGIFSSNITVDPTGISYGVDGFIQVMKTGKSGTLHPEMPWTAFRNLSEDDLRAIYHVLEKPWPVRHIVNNGGKPAFCSVCGQSHGGGGQNELSLPKAMASPSEDLIDAYVGEYHNEQFGISVTIKREGKALRGQSGPWEFPLVAQSENFFLAPGFFAPVRFELTDDGIVQRLVTIDIVEIPFSRTAKHQH
ncbi:MAG: c-type cytochrome [Gammaproteobacteria bacterium]|nr:c-type cytochrome [Gammaproteobacteria bacterium]